MTDPGAAFSVLGGIGAIGVGAWALSRPMPEMVWRELRFPAGLEVAQVEALLDVVAQARQAVVLRIEADHQRIRYGLAAPVGLLAVIEQTLSGIAPGVRLDRLDVAGDVAGDGQYASGLRLHFSGRWSLLRVDQTELSVAALLGSLSGLAPGERLRLHLVVGGARLAGPRRDRDKAQVPTEHQRPVAQKYGQRLLRLRLAVSAVSGSEIRQRQLVDRVVVVLSARAGLRGQLRRQRLSKRALERTFAPGRWSWAAGTASTPVTSSELVALTGWPVGSPPLARVRLGTAPSLPAPSSVPSTRSSSVRQFGVSTHPSQKGRRVSQPVEGGLRHSLLVGGTGSGKSTLVSHLVEQDMLAGRGCLVVDGKGDLVDDLLARIPERRLRDVVVLDPARDGAQTGLRLMPARGRDVELSADLLAGTFKRMWPNTYGVRSAQFLRMGLVTLGHQKQATLVDLPLLLTDQGFRRRALASVSDPLLLAAWQRFESLSPAEQAQQVASPLTKLEELVSRRRLRTVLGQTSPKLNFAEVLGNRRIVLVRLPTGSLGVPAAQLLASLVLWQFLAAVEARAELPPGRRKPFFVYLDEVKALSGIGLPLGDLLERARGLGVGLNLAPQAISQLPVEAQKALLANVGSLVCFRLASDEAKRLASEMPGVEADGLGHLGEHEVAIKLGLTGAASSPVMTARTLPPSPTCSDPTVVRDVAGRNWGADPDEVDRQLTERFGFDSTSRSDEASSGAIGSRRRKP